VDELIKLPFGILTLIGQSNHLLHASTY